MSLQILSLDSSYAGENLDYICDSLLLLSITWQETRLLTLIEGVLAANIFDWGSRACVDLYHKGTIIEIYRMSRDKMQRPWRVRVAVFPFQHNKISGFGF